MDLYTKSVLTIIAISLFIIALKLPLGTAAVAQRPSCGDILNPCWANVTIQR